MPATTWALVTTRPGAATNPEPSWSTPQPNPSTLTVDDPAARTAWRSVASVGSGTGRAEAGASAPNTGGNPSPDRKPWAWLNTVGGAGNASSRVLMIRDCRMALSRATDELLTMVLASSHTVTRAATTATATPATESTERAGPGRTWLVNMPPTIRPTIPKLKAIRSIVESATAVRAVDEWAHLTVCDASRAPTNNPPKNPAMAHTCTRPPTRAPWTAASTATMTMTTSTTFTV